MVVEQIKSSDLNNTVSNTDVCLVDFFANWCGPCKMVAPILEEVSCESGVKIFKIDIEEDESSAIKYKIQHLPTVLVFKNGVEIQRFVGKQTKKTYLQAAEEASL